MVRSCVSSPEVAWRAARACRCKSTYAAIESGVRNIALVKFVSLVGVCGVTLQWNCSPGITDPQSSENGTLQSLGT